MTIEQTTQSADPVSQPATAEPAASQPQAESTGRLSRSEAEASLRSERDAIWEKHHSEADDASDAKVASETGRVRGPDGKFVSRQPAEQADVANEDSTEEHVDASAEQQDDKPKAPATIIPLPRSWSPRDAEIWAKMTPDAQARIAEREMEVARTLSRYGRERGTLLPYARVAEENKDYFTKYGLEAPAAFANLVRTARYLDESPAEALRWLAGHHKVSPIDIFGDPLDWDSDTVQPRAAQAESQELSSLKETVAALRADNEEMKKALKGVSGNIAEQRRAAMQEAFQADMATVEAYEKSEAPDLKDIVDDLVPLIEHYRTKHPKMPKNEVLAKATAAARAMNPKAAEKAAAVKTQRSEKEKIEAAARKAAAARQSSSINVRGAATAAPAALSLKESRDAIWAKHHGT